MSAKMEAATAPGSATSSSLDNTSPATPHHNNAEKRSASLEDSPSRRHGRFRRQRGSGAALSSAAIHRNQFAALTKKNWIVLRSYWLVNLLRCLIIPIAYYVFLGEAKNFFNTTNDLGLGRPAVIHTLADVLDSKPVYWIDSTPAGSAPRFSARDVVDTFTASLSPAQRSLVRQVADAGELGRACPQAFNGLSGCFGAVDFTNITNLGSVAYTLRFDPGLTKVKVSTNDGDAEVRTLPLQWAIDSAILQLNGVPATTYAQRPLEQPYSYSTNAQQAEDQRTGFLGGVPQLSVLAFFIGMLGVVWHLPSSVSEERGSGMTALLTTMGCAQVPRLLSWLCGPAAAYLPAYFVMGGVLSATLWTNTNKGLAIFAHVLPGLAMATWGLFVATFFARANVSSIITTAIAILFAIVALITKHISEGGGVVIGLLFPPASFVYEFLAISAYEREGLPARVLGSNNDINPGPSIVGQIIVQIIAIFMFPILTILLERKLFFAEPFFKWLFRRQRHAAASSERSSMDNPAEKTAGAVPALKITGLTKRFSKKSEGLAVDNLDLHVARGSISCLLGSNGSGKSTTIGVVAGTIRATSGEVLIDGFDRAAAPPGLLGVCPQKDVLYPQLTCTQHVELFRSVKHRYGPRDDALDVLSRCELSHKQKRRPGELSGGQKRRLQLSVALVGQTSLLMIDEGTSGLDPLSRRAIWKILLQERASRTILLTSHFLDEADLLGDQIVILAAPGKKLCEGTPVQLKTQYGQGTYIHTAPRNNAAGVLALLESKCPGARQVSSIDPEQDSFLVPTTNQTEVAAILEAIEQHKTTLHITGYDVAGPSLEDVFLKLNSQHARSIGKDDEVDEIEGKVDHSQEQDAFAGTLSDGSVASVLALTLAQFVKRTLLLRRTYLPVILAILVAVIGSIVPLAFFSDSRDPTCGRGFRDRERSLEATYWFNRTNTTQYLYAAPQANAQLAFGTAFNLTALSFSRVELADYNSSIARLWEADMRGAGGLALPAPGAGYSQLSYVADASMIFPIAALNLVSNAGLVDVRDTTNAPDGSPTIHSSYRPLSNLSLGSGLGSALKWAVVFGLVQAVWPAFATLYPSAEKNNRVKAMALTNGMRAVPLWLGHLLFETPIIIISTVPVALVYAFASKQFAGEGVFWVVLFLYGIAATLQSFVVSLYAPNQLAAFAIVAAWNVLAFLIFFATTLLITTYYVGSGLVGALDAAYYVEAILAPSVSMTRAGFVAVNLFNLLCDGQGGYVSGGVGAISLMGAPIVYLFAWMLVCFAILIFHDSGFPLGAFFMRSVLRRGRKHATSRTTAVGEEEDRVQPVGQGVREEALRLDSTGCDDLLQAKHLDKSYGDLLAVDDVSLGVRREETVALLGINGGGKTTTHALIRGELVPDHGEVTIAGINVAQHRTLARSNIASVPQFDGLDPLLSVGQHLRVYAHIKGVPRTLVRQNVEAAMRVTNLTQYVDRRAGALSGGNMRKLSLAIALMGNPAVLLLDELSSGVDSWTKRGLWQTLRRVGHGRATLLTTHSMEEAQALAERVAIQASRILAFDTIGALRRTHPAYELQLDVQRGSAAEVQAFVQSLFPTAQSSDEASSRFEIPLPRDKPSNSTELESSSAATASTVDSVAALFRTLEQAQSQRTALGIVGYQISPVSLESLFLRIVRQAQSESSPSQ